MAICSDKKTIEKCNAESTLYIQLQMSSHILYTTGELNAATINDHRSAPPFKN